MHIFSLASALIVALSVLNTHALSPNALAHRAIAHARRDAPASPPARLRRRCPAKAASTAPSAAVPATLSPAAASSSAKAVAASTPPAATTAAARPPTSAAPKTTAKPITAAPPPAAPAHITVPGPANGHPFTLTNKCAHAVLPRVGDTKCGYSPRCAGAASYSGAQPGTLAPGATMGLSIDAAWVGRLWASNGHCGPKGENCTMLEFNLDTGSAFTAQAYDISNIQGFTQPISLAAHGCAAVSCASASCPCNQAYPVGDMTGCGADLPVRACGPGRIAFNVVFCP